LLVRELRNRKKISKQPFEIVRFFIGLSLSPPGGDGEENREEKGSDKL
jgi:hypothetical protein